MKDVAEAWTQVIVGSVIIFMSNYFIFSIPLKLNLAMIVVNSFISFVKAYLVRKAFKGVYAT